MIDPETLDHLREQLRECMANDAPLLDELRAEIRPLLQKCVRIQPRPTTAVSLVGADGGNNQIAFDPFLAQVVRVVDSAGNQLFMDVVTPNTDRERLSDYHLPASGEPRTPLGLMMKLLDVRSLWDLSPMIQRPGKQAKPSWIQVYRDLAEWASLLHVIRTKDFGTDTVLVHDGLLRSKVFAHDLFLRYRNLVEESIEHHRRQSRRSLYLCGVAKHSKVLQRYRIAMALEGLLARDYPAYVDLPRSLEEKSYAWAEWGRGDDESRDGEANKFVGGKLFLVKFGSKRGDQVWPVDVLISQARDPNEVNRVLGYLLADAQNGFPVPCYPQCLQQAHEKAALVGFDMEVLQEEVADAVREQLGEHGPVLDEVRFRDADPARLRYGD